MGNEWLNILPKSLQMRKKPPPPPPTTTTTNNNPAQLARSELTFPEKIRSRPATSPHGQTPATEGVGVELRPRLSLQPPGAPPPTPTAHVATHEGRGLQAAVVRTASTQGHRACDRESPGSRVVIAFFRSSNRDYSHYS